MPTMDHLKLTVEDYELFTDDGRRHELVDGDHVVTPAPTVRHQRAVAALHIALHGTAGDAGEVFLSPVDVVLSPTDVVQPDLVFVSRARSAIVGNRIEGAPDLAIEVVSPSSRRLDEVAKRRAYERFGVDELWVVDPEIEVVRIYRREASGAFARPRELAAERGDTLTSPLLPNLELDVAAIFARR